MPDKSRTAFLDIARGVAAILVVYTHIYDVFIRTHKDVRTLPTDVVDNAFVFPLKLDDQGIGAIAVPIFFIISGFVVTPLALRMGGRRFGINRVFRIYPLLIFVVALSAVLIALGRSVLSTRPPDVTVWTFLSNATLWNFIDRPFGSWVAVAWTLAVEILFYALLVAVLPLLRRQMWLAIAVQLWVVLMLLITYRAFADEYRALVINMVYVLIPIMGQAIWAAWTGRIPAWLAGAFVTAAWLMFVWAGHLKVDPEYIPRPFPIAFALMLFLIGLFSEQYLRERRVWTALSDRTYSIYLLHGAVAFPLMHWLFNRLPLWLTVLVAVVATGLAAELAYRFVERPSHHLARRLSRKRAQAREPEPEEQEEEQDREEPTEKLRPVAPSLPLPRRQPVRVAPHRDAASTDPETTRIRPVPRPAPARNGHTPRTAHGTAPTTTGWPTHEHTAQDPEDTPARNGTAPRTNGRSRPENPPARRDSPPTTTGWPTHEHTAQDPEGTPARNGTGPRTNGRPAEHLPHEEKSAPAGGGRHSADANGLPARQLGVAVRAGTGGRRRAPEPPSDTPAFARSVAWPGEQDDPDEAVPSRHRRGNRGVE